MSHPRCNRPWALVLLWMAILVASSPFLSAQTTTLDGTVRDPQGAVIPGVEITLTSAAIQVARTTFTDDTGSYAFLQLPPGTYTLRIELSGFKTLVRENLRLLVDTPTTESITLELGEITEVITVAGESQLLNKTDATIGNAFNEAQIRELPIESRNVVDLLKLQPGVTADGAVSGARSDQSNLTLDGIDVNEQQTGEAFESVLRVTPDSIQEFRVTTSNPNANQGRSSGAQVSLVTKSGTNEFHGSAYWYHRNTVTTANDFFNNRAEGDPDEDGKPGIARPRLIRNLFGGSIGGPIARDKMFFFFNYEGRTDRKQTSVARTIPLEHLGQGMVKYFNTSGELVTLDTEQLNALYPAGVNPAAVAVFADAARRYPNNDPGVGDGINTGGFRFNAPLPLDWNTYTARLDFNLSDKHQLFLRGNYQWDNEAGAPEFPDTPGTATWLHPLGVAVGYTWIPSATLLNNFRYGLTRQAFSQQGDSANNLMNFREVFQPVGFDRTLSRTTPVNNFIDDISWIKGNHSLQLGVNLRFVENQRVSFANAYDYAVANFSWYQGSGAVLTSPIEDLSAGSNRPFRRGVNALIGRLNDYGWSLTYGADGSLLASGSPSERAFATQEYEFYLQDTWRKSSELTLTFGLRWGYNRPVYETSGFQVKPTVSLGEYFKLRKASAAKGVPYAGLITVDRAGPYYDRPGWYEPDWNNLAPRVAFAWSPEFDAGWLRTVFGGRGESVFRGGFSVLYDRIGSALAVAFDLNNTLGFASSEELPANSYNVSDNPAPQFSSFDQDIRSFPGLSASEKLEFPLQHAADGATRITSSLDDTLTTPVNYTWNFSWGRQLPAGLFFEASYLGRAARSLMGQRDIMALNNLVDPSSGLDWYTAGTQLAKWYADDLPIEQMPVIPYFENLFPDLPAYLGLDGYTSTQAAYQLAQWIGPDWTFNQLVLDDMGIYPDMFYQPQYGALNVWSTIASSDYHAFAFTLRERFRDSLNFDLNYTFSKSMDNASGLQNSAAWAAGFIFNPLRPDDNRAVSDFDITHILNANWLWYLPIGNGRAYLNTLPGFLETVLGGWQIHGIVRWNSGLPNTANPFDAGYWATNWNKASAGVRIRDLESSPTKSGDHPNLFGDKTYAYQSYRNAYPGEGGDRNVLRLDSYFALDFGLGKTFRIPGTENHRMEFRWEVFNATNTQRLGSGLAWYGLGYRPYDGEPSPDFGNITDIQGSPRVMQFALRYDF